MPPRKKTATIQKIKEIYQEAKASLTQDPTGDFSYLTRKMTTFPLIVKSPTPDSFYPLLASLAHANRLDLQYRSFSTRSETLSVGLIPDEFLGKIAEICGNWNFAVYLYYQGKFASHHWPLEYKNLDVPKLLGYDPVRPVLLIGFFK